MKRFGPDVRLRLAEDEETFLMDYLPRAGTDDLPPLPLHPLLALVLVHLDRGYTEEDLTDYLSTRLHHDREAMDEIVGDVVFCFRGHFRGEDGDGIALDDEVVEAVFDWLDGTPFRSRQVVFPEDRSLFPQTLEWVVSRYCNRACVYCYQGAIPSKTAKDADLPAERVKGIIDEGVRLGSYNFFITGGEPLLRDDSYDILCHALERGMEPEFITKQYIPEDAAAKLAAAGLKEVFISIDSLDPEAARQLTGIGKFAQGISATVQRLVAHGLDVKAKTVLTPLNIDTMPDTIRGLERLGVSWVGINPYSRNLQRHSDALMLSREQDDSFRDWITDFSAKRENGISISYGADPENRKKEDFSEDFFNCHVSTTALLFLPDGRVSKCDKQLPGDDFILGDLRTQSVHQVWGSRAMIEALKPPRERYKGTPCYDCSYFDTCHERSRCFYDAYLTSGTLYGPQQSSCAFIEFDPCFVC